MTLPQAAKLLNLHPATLRKWIRNGAPTISLGEVGRGHGTTVDLEQLKTWRATRAVPTLADHDKRDTLSIVSTALLDALKRDALAGKAGLTEGQAAMVVLVIFERCYRNIHKAPLTADTLPPELKPFGAIVLQSIESGSFITSRRT
ncbi:MAG: helix-turn-helix domain-containing protein [Nitrospirae bacterium]|nr:helix-turn-helix domain-containing protein [Nitrospirota bacterium]